MEKIEKLSKEIGADDFVFGSVIYPKSDGDRKPLRYRLENEEVKCFYEFYNIGPREDAPEEEDEEKEGDLSLTCGAGRTLINITPSGKVTPCLSLPMELGDVSEKPLREILGSAKMESVVESIRFGNVEKCRDCDDKLICFRCPGLSYLEEGDACGAPEEACRLTRIRNE